MNCFNFRQRVLEDPYHLPVDAKQHLSTCSHCARYMSEIETLDNNIRNTFSVTVPEGLPARILLNQSLTPTDRSPKRWYWLGVAASLFVAILLVFQVPNDTMADSIVTHLEHEAHQVHGRAGQIGSGKVTEVLGSIGLSMKQPLGNVTYASICVIDDRLVAHLVVEYRNKTYTLLALPIAPGEAGTISDERWVGVIANEGVVTFAVVTETATSSQESLQSAYTHFNQSIGQLALAQ